jgi:hypothetical protein
MAATPKMPEMPKMSVPCALLLLGMESGELAASDVEAIYSHREVKLNASVHHALDFEVLRLLRMARDVALAAQQQQKQQQQKQGEFAVAVPEALTKLPRAPSEIPTPEDVEDRLAAVPHLRDALLWLRSLPSGMLKIMSHYGAVRRWRMSPETRIVLKPLESDARMADAGNEAYSKVLERLVAGAPNCDELLRLNAEKRGDLLEVLLGAALKHHHGRQLERIQAAIERAVDEYYQATWQDWLRENPSRFVVRAAVIDAENDEGVILLPSKRCPRCDAEAFGQWRYGSGYAALCSAWDHRCW